jgi:trimethylamine--corrinoid protein Co-methyltransferase
MFLSKAKARLIHESSLRILANTGIKLDNEEAEELLLEAGAKRDGDNRILVPPQLVEKTIARTSPKLQLYDRSGAKAIVLKAGKTYFGPGSDALYNIDRHTGNPRLSTLEDVAANVTIADALTEIDFVMSMALPTEVSSSSLYPTVFAEMVRHTTKPIVTTATNLEDIKRVHSIAKLIVGGEEQLRRKPFFIAYLEPNSPLIVDRSSAERLLYCAEHEIPFLYAAGANMGCAAPVSLAGAVAQGNAESLIGLVIASLKNPSARFIHGSNTSSVDMSHGKVLYGAPEWFKTVAMYADMGRYYNLPTWGTGGCSDALYIDPQAGFEAYEGVLMSVLSGPTLVHDVGYLAYGFLYDIRMLILANEIIRRARHLMQVVDLSDETSSAQAIDDVARERGYKTFFEHPHTADHFRTSLWLPPRFIRRRLLDAADQQSALTDMLWEEVDTILAERKAESLPQEIANQLDYVLGKSATVPLAYSSSPGL